MKLSELNLTPDHVRGLERLLGKLNATQGAARDADDITRRTYGVSVKAGSVNTTARTVDVVASSEAIDAYNEIVEQDWRLDRYRANPVVLYQHNAVGLCGPAEETLPIGRASNVRVVDGKLEARIHFVDARANPLAERIFEGFRQGSLRAVSVGFRPGAVRREKRGDREVVILSAPDLYEISVCPVPANPDAVARSAAGSRTLPPPETKATTPPSDPAPRPTSQRLLEACLEQNGSAGLRRGAPRLSSEHRSAGVARTGRDVKTSAGSARLLKAIQGKGGESEATKSFGSNRLLKAIQD